MTGCNHHNGVTEQTMSVHESGSRMNRNRNWFRRAASLVAGPGPLRQQQQHRLAAPVLTTPTTAWTTVQSSSLHHVVTSNGINNVIDDIPTTEHVTTPQPQSAWKPEPSTPPEPEPEPDPQQQQQPMTMSSNSRRQQIFSYQHTRSYNNNDDENEETISENLNSAINSLLDFQTADLEAVVPNVGRNREGTLAVTAVDDERYELSAAARSNLSRQVSIDQESGSWDNSWATSATVVTEIRANCERQRSTSSGRWPNNKL